MKISTFVLFVLISVTNIAYAQDDITIDDYDRAVSFMRDNYHNKTAFNLSIRPHWYPDSSGVWFIHNAPDEKRYLKISLPEQVKSDLFDHDKLAQVLTDSLGESIKPNELPVSGIEIKTPDELMITISMKGKKYTVDTKNYSLNETPPDDAPQTQEAPSPDNKWIAYTENYNLFIRSTETKEVKQLSIAGEKGYEYASWVGWADIMEGENADRPEHFGVNWSEDSEWIAASICDTRSADKMYLLDWSIDSTFRPKLLSYYRGSPGDTTMVYMDPVFFNVKTGKEVKPDLPRATHINSIGVRRSEKPGLVYLYQPTRGYQNINIYTFDLNTEDLQILYSESSDTNIDNFIYDIVEESGLMFYLSEKSGWRQLYSLNLETNEEISISNGDYYINSIVKIDDDNQRIFFMASGKESGRNPYYQLLYSISFDGTDLKLLTPEDVHHAVSMSPDEKYFVDNYSTVNVPTITALRSTSTGEILMELGRADVSGLANWSPPEVFTVTARDGKTTNYGALWKPTNFDPTKKYPVVEMSYTGPHTQVFPKEFRQAIGWQSTAELGFILVLVDGLGSSGRSKHYHNYSYKNLGGNLEDHMLAIKELGRRYSWFDTSRVGIFGHSAGGYDAGHAVLAYPDFYKVAVASSADHDHRMEKAWWPEMYMGWPIDSAYHKQSNITMAGNLKGKLLITHGGIDENVNPSATFKLAEALIKADKQFDMLILPSQRHGYRGQHQKYFTKTRWNYFIKHLRGVEPIWEFEWE